VKGFQQEKKIGWLSWKNIKLHKTFSVLENKYVELVDDGVEAG